MRARLVRTIAIPLGIGLLATLAVSWALAARSAYGWGWSERSAARLRDPARGEGDGEIRLHIFSGYGWAIVETAARELTYLPPEYRTPDLHTRAPGWSRRAVFPWMYGDAPWPAVGDRGGRGRCSVRGTGWPLIAFWHGYDWKPGLAVAPWGDYLTPGGIRLEPNRNGNPGAWPIDYPRALPYRPAWLGLLADTFLYATVFGLVIRGPGSIRRFRRRRAGRCVRCAYDLHGLPAGATCPECGHPREHRCAAAPATFC